MSNDCIDSIDSEGDDGPDAKGDRWTVQALLLSAKRTFIKGLTVAGHELVKHGGQGEFPIPTGSYESVSKLAQEQLEEIMNNPSTRIQEIAKGNFRGGNYYIAPDGRVAAFDRFGVFRYFGIF